MDLRTIMNSDAAGASNPPPQPRQSPGQAQSHSEPAFQQPPQQQQQQHAASISYPPGYAAPPPQPPPLHPLHTSPDRTSSYGSLQSPYQYNSSSTLSAQSQQGQSPHGSVPYPPSRDSYSAGYNHQQQQQPPPQPGILASPYTPQPMSAGPQHPEQQSYFAPQRSQSIQSVPNPYSHSSYSFHSRESPHSGPSQVYPPQQFSPSTQKSLPGTPIRPPVGSYSHQSPSARPQSSGHDSQPTQRSSPWTAQDNAQDQRNMISPDAQRHSRQNSQQVEPATRHYSGSSQRERSESVSPKTILMSGYRQENAGVNQQALPQWNYSQNQGLNESPPGPNSWSGHGAQIPQASPGAPPLNSTPPSKMNISSSRTGSSPPPPMRKKMRYDEPPIYAQRARTKGKPPVIPNRRPPIPKHLRNSKQDVWLSSKRSSSANLPPTAPAPVSNNQVEDVQPTNGPSVAHQPPEPPQMPAQVGSLGPWEPSITGFIPHEEITKFVCDFLFRNVVMRNDVAAGPAGSAAPGQGAIIEVEGKLGHLIDIDSRDRLQLPVLTETILNKEYPRFRTSFESSMTLEQHRAMNNFLNEAVKASMPHTNPGRIPLSYAHKKERDTFYEVQPADLPPVIRQNLNPRHKPKVRVTTDQRTGEVIAKIVKCRIADLDVHSPLTTVDYRISVNLEMNYDGDVSHLPIVDGAKGNRGGDRNKDRMSYRHLAYQIDLTQVAKAEPPTKSDFEHELEVEISAAEIKRQGQLAMAGDPKNQYEDLIKGFVDNIRVLARSVPP